MLRGHRLRVRPVPVSHSAPPASPPGSAPYARPPPRTAAGPAGPRPPPIAAARESSPRGLPAGRDSDATRQPSATAARVGGDDGPARRTAGQLFQMLGECRALGSGRLRCWVGARLPETHAGARVRARPPQRRTPLLTGPQRAKGGEEAAAGRQMVLFITVEAAGALAGWIVFARRMDEAGAVLPSRAQDARLPLGEEGPTRLRPPELTSGMPRRGWRRLAAGG